MGSTPIENTKAIYVLSVKLKVLVKKKKKKKKLRYIRANPITSSNPIKEQFRAKTYVSQKMRRKISREMAAIKEKGKVFMISLLMPQLKVRKT